MPYKSYYRIFLTLLLLVFGYSFIQLQAQQFVFATLKGSPMNTKGWNLVGDAKIGDTPGDPNNAKDELIVCHDSTWNSGACFYNTPINLGVCSKWTAEFDYRIFDGTGADGMAFCFLTNPPNSYVNGGGCGIPSKPTGIMVVLDIFKNCGTTTPKLELAYGDGTQDYNECNLPANQYVSNLAILRDNNYNHIKITYKNGNIEVYINNTLYLTGYYLANYPGYLGFTSSTGTITDNHSIKNAIIYTSMPAVDAGNDVSFCSGTSVSIGVPSKPNYNYNWSPATGLSDPTASNPKITLINNTGNTQIFTYKVTTDSSATGCSSVDSVIVTVKPSPNIFLGKDTSFCQGNTLTLDAGNGYQSYLWSTNAATSSITAATTGLYWVEVTNNSLCSSRDSINITVNPNPKVNLGKDTTFCQGGSVTLNAGNGFTKYLWSTNENTPSVTKSQTGKYWVDVTDINQCKGSDTVIVVSNPLPIIDLGKDTTICDGNILILNPGNGFKQYLWSDNQTTPTLDATIAGKYWVHIVDNNNCTASDTIIVLTKPRPVFSLGNDTTICEGRTVHLQANYPTATAYLWQDGSTSPDYTVNKQGIYWLKVFNSCGPTADSVNINFTPTLKIDMGTDVTSCFNQYTISAGKDYKNLLWSTGDTNISINVSSSGSYSLTAYQKTDGCKAEGTITITKKCEYAVYIPNAFISDGSYPSKKLIAYGTNISSFKMYIFNRWGKLVYIMNDMQDTDGKGWPDTSTPIGMYVWTAFYRGIEGDRISAEKKINGFVTVLK